MKSLRTVKEAPWVQNTVQYHASQSPPRRGADSTNHRVATWQSAPPSRGRFVAGCQVSARVLRSIATYVNPWPGRGRLVTGYQARTTSRPAGRLAGRRSWEGMEGMCPQPEARTNAHCSVTAPVRYLRRMCEDLNLRRQRGGTPVGLCVGGCGEGVGGEPRRQSFVKLSRSINDKKASFGQIGYLSFPRHIDCGYPRAWTS